MTMAAPLAMASCSPSLPTRSPTRSRTRGSTPSRLGLGFGLANPNPNPNPNPSPNPNPNPEQLPYLVISSVCGYVSVSFVLLLIKVYGATVTEMVKSLRKAPAPTLIRAPTL